MDTTKRVLELFSGTGSVGKVAIELGYDVISLDIDDYEGRFPPTHKVNLLDWDYKQYPNNHFSWIHASPPCMAYASMQNTWVGRYKKLEDDETKYYLFTKEIMEANMKESDKLVIRTLEIIDYFLSGNKDLIWVIENGFSSKLKKREFMVHLPFYIVSYCKYSTWGYKKDTILFTNLKNFIPKRCRNDCDNRIEGTRLHKYTCGSWGKKGTTQQGIGRGIGNSKYSCRILLFRIPPQLIKELLFTKMKNEI